MKKISSTKNCKIIVMKIQKESRPYIMYGILYRKLSGNWHAIKQRFVSSEQAEEYAKNRILPLYKECYIEKLTSVFYLKAVNEN